MSGACLVVLLLCKDLSIARLLTNTTEVEPGLETFQVSEDVWQQEVQQTPQLTQVILQRCACTTLIMKVSRRAHDSEKQATSDAENHAVIYLYMRVHTTCLCSKALTADKLLSSHHIMLNIPHMHRPETCTCSSCHSLTSAHVMQQTSISATDMAATDCNWT